MSQPDMEFGTPPLNSLNTQEMVKLIDQTSSQLFLDAGLFSDYIQKLGSQEKITPSSTQEIIELIHEMTFESKKSQSKINLSNQLPTNLSQISNCFNDVDNKNNYDLNNCKLKWESTAKKRHIQKYLETCPNYINGSMFQHMETKNYQLPIYSRYSEPAFYGEFNTNGKRIRSSSLSTCKSSLQPDFSDFEQGNSNEFCSTTSDTDENNNVYSMSLKTEENSNSFIEYSINDSEFKDSDGNSDKIKTRRSKVNNKDRASFLKDRKERNRLAAQKLRDKRRSEKEAIVAEMKMLEERNKLLYLEIDRLTDQINKYRHFYKSQDKE